MAKRRTTSIFKQEVYDLVGDEYNVLGEYKSSNVKVLMRHNICNHEWFVSPNNFLRGSRCPNEANNKKRPLSNSKKKLKI